jgi:hypothetical protein
MDVKTLREINKQFATGNLKNKSSLEFALDLTRKYKNWKKQLAILLRAILVDHIFDDGNKRTAAFLIANEFNKHKVEVDEDRIVRLVIKVAKHNITDVDKIRRLIENEI